MQVSFRHGIVKSTPNFLQVTGGTVSLSIPTPDYVLLTVADGNATYLIAEKTSVSNAWTGIVPGTNHWLYWDIHPITGEKTYGHTSIEPVYALTPPASPAHDQHWFDLASSTTKVWNSVGSRWVKKIRVFAAQITSGGAVVSVSRNAPAFEGSQVSSFANTSIQVGFLVFDEAGKALRKGDGTFFTTADVGITGVSSATRVKMGTIVRGGEANENMANNTVVVFTDFDHISPATPALFTTSRQVGIIEEDVVIGGYVNIVTEGLVTSMDWDWSSYAVDTPLYVGLGGVLTTISTAPALDPVALIVGKHSIYFGIINLNHVEGAILRNMTNVAAGIGRLSVPAANALDAVVVGDNDPRLTDARTPVAHTHGVLEVTGAVSTTDPRLTDARTPVAHTHGVLEVTGAVSTTDPRLTDARTPVAHTHTISEVTNLQTTLDSKFDKAGGALTGALTLPGNPTLALHAATKQYVDTLTMPYDVTLACSDTITALEISTAAAWLIAARSFNVSTIRADLLVASTSGSVDLGIVVNGVTIDTISIAQTLTTASSSIPHSITAADKVVVQITAAGTGAIGLIVTFIGTV